MASRKTEMQGLVGRPVLSPEHALFLSLRWGGWNFVVGLLGVVLPQIPPKNGMLLQACHRRVDREISDIHSSMQKCYSFTRMLLIYKTAIVIQVS